MKAILRKHSMIRLFWFKKYASDETPEIPLEGASDLFRLLPKNVETKKALLGKFAIMSSDIKLTAPEMINLYKTQEVVEHEFHLLKSILKIRPFHHRVSERIDAHVAIISWGMVFLSVLKNLLEQEGLSYSFEELLRLIKQSYLQQTIFLYYGFKNYKLTRTAGITPELAEILHKMKFKPQPFQIEYLHPHSEPRKSKMSGRILKRGS